MRNCPKITVQAGALFGLALLLLIMELPWVTGFLISAAFHEGCHLAVLYLFKAPVHHISIGMTGAKIDTAPLSRQQEFLCALAGPFGSLILSLFCTALPRLALCSFFHCVCNLFPFYPLDGGRALRSILPEKSCHYIQWSLILLLLLRIIRFAGKIGMIASLVIIGRPLLEKYLAKIRSSGYNKPTIKKEVWL